MTLFAMSWPMTKQRLIYAVSTPRRATGQTSEAYAGAIVAYIPRMRPPMSSPANKTFTDRAKNCIKMNAAVPITHTAKV